MEVVQMQVLTGYDGSKESEGAVRWAARIAEAHGEPLVVIRAWELPSLLGLPVPDPAMVETPEDVEAALRADLEHLIRELPEGVRVRPDVIAGPAAHSLIEASKRPAVRALVVGSRGRGGFTDLVLGSVARACLGHAHCPVVIVPPGAPSPERLERIMVGMDGSEHSARALRWACELARATGATTVPALAYLPDQSELRPRHAAILRERAESDLHTWCEGVVTAGDRTVLLEGDARRALLDAIDVHDADLVVVGSRGLGRFSRLFVGSVADAVAHHSRVPVAVIRQG